MFSRAIEWWDNLNDEKKSLLHFVAHILEFAFLIVLVAVVLEMKIDRMRRVAAASERAEHWNQLAIQYAEQSKSYGEWLKAVRAKEGLTDSLAKTAGDKTP